MNIWISETKSVRERTLNQIFIINFLNVRRIGIPGLETGLPLIVFRDHMRLRAVWHFVSDLTLTNPGSI